MNAFLFWTQLVLRSFNPFSNLLLQYLLLFCFVMTQRRQTPFVREFLRESTNSWQRGFYVTWSIAPVLCLNHSNGWRQLSAQLTVTKRLWTLGWETLVTPNHFVYSKLPTRKCAYSALCLLKLHLLKIMPTHKVPIRNFWVLLTGNHPATTQKVPRTFKDPQGSVRNPLKTHRRPSGE